MNTPALPESPAIDSLYADIRQLVESSRLQVLTQVNQALVLTYWQIGKTIKERVITFCRDHQDRR